MYTEVSKYLGDFLEHVRKSDLPPAIKPKAISTLEYFHSQSLCDLDRRDSLTRMRIKWNEFEKYLSGTNLISKIQRDEVKWRAICSFVGTMPVADLPSEIIPVRPDKWANAEAHQFFEYLARASEEKNVLTSSEILAMRFGLYYLELESKRTRFQRDRARIRFTWRYLQPLLQKANLLQQFYAEKALIRRVKSFVADSIL